MQFKIIDVLLGNYTLSPYQQKIRQDFLNFLKTKKPNSSLTWLDPTIWVREIWAPITDKIYTVIHPLPFKVKSEIHQTLHLIYGNMPPENRLKSDTYPRFISRYKGMGLCFAPKHLYAYPDYGFVLPDKMRIDDYGRILAKKLFEKRGWRYELKPVFTTIRWRKVIPHGFPPAPPVWTENLVYGLFASPRDIIKEEGISPIGKDLGIVHPDPEKNKNIKGFVNPHGAIEFYIPNKYYDAIKKLLCEKKQKKECIVKLCLEWKHRRWFRPYRTSCERPYYGLSIEEVCIPKPAAFEFFNTVLDEFFKKYPQYKNEINGWFKALLAIDYVDNIKVPFKKNFENYIKKRAKEIVLSFSNFYAKPKLKEKSKRRVWYKIGEYKAPLTFNKVFLDFVDSNPSKYLLALYYLFDLGAYSYFNIFFRLIGQPAWIKAQTLYMAYVYSSGKVGKNFYLFDFIYPGEYLAFYARIAGMKRKEFIQKEIPNYLDLTNKIAKLKKEVEPLEKQVSSLYKAYTGKEYVFPLPALGPLWWQKYEAFLIKEKEELPQTIKEIKTYGKELETIKPEIEKLKKELVKEAEELNKLYGKKVIDVAKVLPPTIPVALSIAKQVEYCRNLKSELVKSITMIKEKKKEITTALEKLKKVKPEVEKLKKEFTKEAEELNKLYGKKVVDVEKVLPAVPTGLPVTAQIEYYENLKNELIKGLKAIKEKKNEIKTTLEKLKESVEPKIKKLFEMEDKLTTIVGKKVIDVSKIISEEPKTYPEKVVYYQKLKEQLPQVEKVLEKEIEKASQMKAKEELKAIMPILPIAVLGGLLLLQSSQRASE